MSELSLFIPQFKNKYAVDWCNLCDCAIITCPKCKNSSCNGGGCDECIEDFRVWCKRKISVLDYLSEEEKKQYIKFEFIKDFILDTVTEHAEIDFCQLKKDGRLSRKQEDLLANYLKD